LGINKGRMQQPAHAHVLGIFFVKKQNIYQNYPQNMHFLHQKMHQIGSKKTG
jgi:hypothetical protein